MTADLELKIETLINLITLERAERQRDRMTLEKLLDHITRLDRAHALPLNYSLRQTCQVLGDFKESWGRKHLADLPTPVQRKPLRFRVSDVEALAASGFAKRFPRQRRSA